MPRPRSPSTIPARSSGGEDIKEPREIVEGLGRRIVPGNGSLPRASPLLRGGGGVISIKEADPPRFCGFRDEDRPDEGQRSSVRLHGLQQLPAQFTEGVAHFGSDVKVRGLTEMVAKALD